jgi:hypothetical protein
MGKPRYSTLVKLAKDLLSCVEDEVNAAGEDDHPVIMGHARVARKARKILYPKALLDKGE